MNEATVALPWKGLYNDSKVKAAWEKTVAMLLPQYVKQLAGEDYFTGVSVSIQKPEPPAAIVKALAGEQVAVAENNAQLERNATIATELASIRALVKVLGPYGYVLYQAEKDGKLPLMPVPAGGSINVAPPAR
jgi:hypothetical protein